MLERREFLAAAIASPAFPSSAQTAPRLRAGAATSNITPALGTSLDGTISQNGPAVHVHDELHARCLALDDGTSALAIVVCDNTMISRDVFDRARQLAASETRLPAERMLMSATHNHSSPRAIGLTGSALEKEYEQFLARRIADCIRIALNNLAPAEIGWGTASMPQFLFNRRYFVRQTPPNPFGEAKDRVQMNPSGDERNIIKPAGPVDPELFAISVRHADGRPLALLANYGLHYAGGFGPGHVSADYFGYFCDHVHQLLRAGRQDPPFVAILSNGTSGDVNGIDFRKPRTKEPPYSQMREIGHAVAEEAARIAGRIEYTGSVSLNVLETELELEVRKPSPERLAWARGVRKTPDLGRRNTRVETYARETLLLDEFPRTVSLRLQAIRIGKLGIAAIPCEVFAETGLAIKRNSRLQPSFVIELANGFGGYLPTPEQHAWGGYETWACRSSFLEIQAEPKIRSAVLKLLGAA
jgi:hypothetical protein